MNNKISPNDFFETMKLNLNNKELSDAEFCQFIRNSTEGMVKKKSLILYHAEDGKQMSIDIDDDTTADWLKRRINTANRLEIFIKQEQEYKKQQRT